MRTALPPAAPIFRSEGQARLLAALLLSQDELSLTDLAERTQLAYPTAHREAERLLDAGVLAARRIGRTRLVRANPHSPLVPPLREILLIGTGPVVLLADALATIPRIDRAFLYGPFAARARGEIGPAPEDIEMMVIGAPDPVAVDDVCEQVEVRVGRRVNAMILSPQEWAEDSGFLRDVRERSRVAILGGLP
ncbi:winged helix-turn-helix domain-containing protein [Raineyella sp. LH-20]|uniref:winged helix-turn-helix domain-containing protein n=1 Tax=Raineyella sp. LH-20 TaxID=3081204 RepID=UPI002953B8AC|nr:winged helix-turn-helix domain-containing protein [Raineyella sp. LH-20]WOP18737.1 winged helix-turn-helix domain-containing protein [Raineyella sp. LH-20]